MKSPMIENPIFWRVMFGVCLVLFVLNAALAAAASNVWLRGLSLLACVVAGLGAQASWGMQCMFTQRKE